MTNEEIICEWMEPKPRPRTHSTDPSVNDWWSLDMYGSEWRPRKLTLDALHEVEERLTEDVAGHCQLEDAYILALDEIIGGGDRGATMFELVHATPEQKIKALAAVLKAGIRTPVEGEKP